MLSKKKNPPTLFSHNFQSTLVTQIRQPRVHLRDEKFLRFTARCCKPVCKPKPRNRPNRPEKKREKIKKRKRKEKGKKKKWRKREEKKKRKRKKEKKRKERRTFVAFIPFCYHSSIYTTLPRPGNRSCYYAQLHLPRIKSRDRVHTLADFVSRATGFVNERLPRGRG